MVTVVVAGGRRRAGTRYNVEVPMAVLAVVDVVRSVVALVVRAGVVVTMAGRCLAVVCYLGTTAVRRSVVRCSLCYGRKDCQYDE